MLGIERRRGGDDVWLLELERPCGLLVTILPITLRPPEDVAEYLAAAFEEGGGDAAYMAHVIGVAARAPPTSTCVRRHKLSTTSRPTFDRNYAYLLSLLSSWSFQAQRPMAVREVLLEDKTHGPSGLFGHRHKRRCN